MNSPVAGELPKIRLLRSLLGIASKLRENPCKEPFLHYRAGLRYLTLRTISTRGPHNRDILRSPAHRSVALLESDSLPPGLSLRIDGNQAPAHRRSRKSAASRLESLAASSRSNVRHFECRFGGGLPVQVPPIACRRRFDVEVTWTWGGVCTAIMRGIHDDGLAFLNIAHENGIMGNFICLPDARREVTENPT